MKPQTSITSVDVDENLVAYGRSPSWGAIFAGATAGLAVHFLLLMLGAATGLGAADPATDNNPIATFGMGAAIVWSISALISLWVGGWVAGRYAARGYHVTGCVHGFLVWCLASVIGVLLVVSGAGSLVGGAAQIAGEGVAKLGKSAAGVADMAKQTLEQSGASLNSMVDEVVEVRRSKNGGVGVAAAQREVGQAVRQLFREGGNLKDPEARTALQRALVDSGLSQQDATQTIDRWTASFERMQARAQEMKAAAAAKAREAADKAAEALAHAALWTFIGFVLGAFAAAWGGLKGARWEYRHHPQVSEPIITSSAARHA